MGKEAVGVNQHRNRLWSVLVAVVLLLVVAAIVYPVFVRKHISISWSACSGNAKQLCLGLIMYADDNDGRMPSRGEWLVAIGPYAKTDGWRPVCPLDPRWQGLDPAKGESSYGLSPLAPARLYRLNAPPEYEHVPLLFEATSAVGLQNVAAYRHSKKVWGKTRDGLAVGFCDGHVKWVSRSEFEKMRMQP